MPRTKQGWIVIILFFFCAFVPLGSSHPISTPQSGNVAGYVIDSQTRAPVVRASVRIVEFPKIVATTDTNGHFMIKDVPAGEYHITANKQGYVDGLPISFGPNFVYAMVRAGVVSGRVVDDDGGPMRGVQVRAFVDGYQHGRRQLLQRGNTAATNDRGEFRLFWLNPGAYYIAASTPETAPLDPDVRFVTTYYPGVSEAENAEMVRVESGETDVRAIQMTTLPLRVIRGRINGPTRPELIFFFAAGVRSLSALSRAPVSVVNLGRPENGQDFQINAGIMPGQYRLDLLANGSGALYLATTSFSIGATDPPDLAIHLSPALTVEGRVEIQPDNPISKLPAVSVSCTSDVSLPNISTVTGEVRSDGLFKLENVFPNRYSVHLSGLRGTTYLAEVSLQGMNVSPDSVDFPADVPSVTMTLTLRNDGGRVRGRTRANSTVVIVPKTPFELWPDRYRFAVSNDAGEYQIDGIAPGRYSILAFEQIEPGAYQDTNFLRRFENLASELIVEASGEQRIDPPWIPKS